MIKKILTTILLLLTGWSVLSYAKDIALPEIGDSSGEFISPAEEFAIGQSFYWRLQQSVDLINDPEVEQYIESLGSRLAANSDEPQLHYKFFMVSNNQVNAFATPGGFIGVNSGLILTSESEDEVASVLGHEISHITQRHLLRSFEQQKRLSVPLTVAAIAGLLLGIADPSLGSAAIMATQAGGVQSQINFTRAHEREADNIGMKILVRSGFDAMAMPRFFERLQQANRFSSGKGVPEFLRSHPVTTARIAEARGRAVKFPLKQSLRDTLKYHLIREKLRVMTSTNKKQLIEHYQHAVESGLGARKKAIEYGYSLALSKIGRHEQARGILQKLSKQDKDRLAYQLALAEIEIKLGRLSTALTIYDESQRLYPDDYALTMGHVRALLLAKRPQKAILKLEKQLTFGKKSPKLYKALAQAQEAMGQKSESHMSLAEYYYVSGRLKQAADQLKIAADYAKGNDYQQAKISARLREVEVILDELERPS